MFLIICLPVGNVENISCVCGVHCGSCYGPAVGSIVNLVMRQEHTSSCYGPAVVSIVNLVMRQEHTSSCYGPAVGSIVNLVMGQLWGPL